MIDSGDYRQYRVSAPLYGEGLLNNLTSGYATYSAGLGINRWGEVVGSYLPRWTGYFLGRPGSNPPLPAELRDKEAFIANSIGVTNLNSLIDTNSGWRLLEATDINDGGHIVGFGLKEGEIRAFRLDPVLSLSAIKTAETGATGTIQAMPGATVNIEASADFKQWRPVSTQSANGYVATFTDDLAAGTSFYRAVIPQN
jgi:hypothetical protein